MAEPAAAVVAAPSAISVTEPAAAVVAAPSAISVAEPAAAVVAAPSAISMAKAAAAEPAAAVVTAPSAVSLAEPPNASRAADTLFAPVVRPPELVLAANLAEPITAAAAESAAAAVPVTFGAGIEMPAATLTESPNTAPRGFISQSAYRAATQRGSCNSHSRSYH